MTPPHELCHEDHARVAKAIENLGYSVTVTDRLPSDCCGDLTHRDRWFMVARLRPVGTLDIGEWANKEVRPAHRILDPIEHVDERLWIEADITLWDDYRMGRKRSSRTSPAMTSDSSSLTHTGLEISKGTLAKRARKSSMFGEGLSRQLLDSRTISLWTTVARPARSYGSSP